MTNKNAFPDYANNVEVEIVSRAIGSLLKAGYAIRVYDGEEWAMDKPSRDREAISKECFATDITEMVAYKDGKRAGWIMFVHGNGADVLSDYSTALEDVLKSANAYAENAW